MLHFLIFLNLLLPLVYLIEFSGLFVDSKIELHVILSVCLSVLFSCQTPVKCAAELIVFGYAERTFLLSVC